MAVFVIAAMMVALGHLVAAAQRPRLALIVSGILWLLYGVWEYLIATGVTCDTNCNIRVDLLLIFPILAIATVYARRAYMRPPGQPTVVGMVLGAAGLVIVAVVSVLFGYIAPVVVAGVCALALGGYAIKLRYKGTSL